MKLTKQEARIADHITQGLANKAIAHQLDLSEHTVKVHMRNMFKKFGLTNRTQLALLYIKSNTPNLHDDSYHGA